LEKVKERIVEYLAVQQRVGKNLRGRSCVWWDRPASARPRLGQSHGALDEP
jgi:ATP-dependent Lon protease